MRTRPMAAEAELAGMSSVPLSLCDSPFGGPQPDATIASTPASTHHRCHVHRK
jgi:hypothetical protein